MMASGKRSTTGKRLVFRQCNYFSKVQNVHGNRKRSHSCEYFTATFIHIQRAGTVNEVKDYILLLGYAVRSGE